MSFQFVVGIDELGQGVDKLYLYLCMTQPFPISKTVEHFAGLFYVQSLSSMLPSLILEPKPNEIILDIASAPGS